MLGVYPTAAHFVSKKLSRSVEAAGRGGYTFGRLFYRLVDTFSDYPDDGALLDAAFEKGLSSLIAELRHTEDGNQNAGAYPGLSPATTRRLFFLKSHR